MQPLVMLECCSCVANNVISMGETSGNVSLVLKGMQLARS